MNYKELKQFYSDHFSLGYLNTNYEQKAALISLICYVTYQAKMKKPDVSHYQIIMKISEGMNLPEDFIKGLSIVCEDLSYGCKEFPIFGLNPKDIIKNIKEILNTYVPF